MKQILSVILFWCLLISAKSQEKRVSLLFAGDAMQHMPQVNAAKSHSGYNYDSCFYLISDKVKAADLSSVNFETTLGGKPYRGYPLFSSPDEFAVALKSSGFHLFFLANNHILDRSKHGLERTIDVLDSIQVKHTGVFKNSLSRGLNYPLMMIKHGIRIAFLNYTYGANGLKVSPPNIVNFIDTAAIKKDLRLTRLYDPDIIIANMHWGEEYHTVENHEQRELADFLFRNGVRIIIGNHPHVVQPLVKNVSNNKIESVVYYSLGNFISNQQKIHTDGGAIAEITLKKTKENKVEIESAGYSLVWVRKFTHNNKLNYVLIPDYADLNEISPPLSFEELQKMNIFATNAKRIIER